MARVTVRDTIQLRVKAIVNVRVRVRARVRVRVIVERGVLPSLSHSWQSRAKVQLEGYSKVRTSAACTQTDSQGCCLIKNEKDYHVQLRAPTDSMLGLYPDHNPNLTPNVVCAPTPVHFELEGGLGLG